MTRPVDIEGDTGLAQERYALVPPARRASARFPESTVTVVSSAAEALAGADPARNRLAAVVYGPSPSSEGLRIYYLVRWL